MHSDFKLLAKHWLQDAGVEPQQPTSLRPVYSEEDLNSIKKVLLNESVWRSNSEAVDRLIQSFRQKVCARDFNLVVSSASAGLHTVLSYYLRRRGKYVIVPSYTWYSVIASILNVGGIPLFVDIEIPSLKLAPFQFNGIAPDQIACAVPSHLFGIPSLVDNHLLWLKDRNIPLIEDCAQCVKGRVGDRPVGKLGDCSVFSFNGSKHIPAGEGGLIASDNIDLANFCQNFIMTVDAPKEISVIRFNTASEGWNYRLASISASLAESLTQNLENRICDGIKAGSEFSKIIGQFYFLTAAGLPTASPVAHLGLPFYVNVPLKGMTLAESRELLYYMLRYAGVPASVWVAEPVQKTVRMKIYYAENFLSPNSDDYRTAQIFSDSHIVIPADTRAFSETFRASFTHVFQIYGTHLN